jgi:hypothetical protein
MFRKLLLVVPFAMVLVAGCGGSTTPAPPTPSATSAPATTTAVASGPAPVSSVAVPSQGCAPGGGGTPAGATTHPIIDVDGDGKTDTGWATSNTSTGGDTTFGVTTASGATFSTPFASASPIRRSALFGNADGKGQIVMIASDGRQAPLFVVADCAITVVTNQQGQQYTFDLGLHTGNGTGVGCSTLPKVGAQSLVGLKLTSDNNGDPQSVTATQIVLQGTTAHNGEVVTTPETNKSSPAVTTASEITCGNDTVATSGVTAPSQ